MTGRSLSFLSTGLSLRTLDLVSLRLLLSAIDEGNLAKVAAKENISLSAVSRRISDLEARLGVTLLHRHDRGVTPTDAAQMVEQRLRSVFNLLSRAADDLHDVYQGRRGVVRVHAHLTAVAGILPARLAAFKAQHAHIDIIVDESTSVDILHAVQVGDCDVGLVSGTVNGGTLTLLPWSMDELVVVMPPNHDLAKADAVRFADIVDLPFIGMSKSSALQTFYRGQAAAVGRRLDERARVSTFEGVRRMVAVGLGVAILPVGVVSSALETGDVAVRRLAEPWSIRPLMICLRDRAQLSSAANFFVDFLLATSNEKA
jgi:DNA-binding transcriptional LysR family regulator